MFTSYNVRRNKKKISVQVIIENDNYFFVNYLIIITEFNIIVYGQNL